MARLLSGRFRDPLVGRDVLVGSLLGAALAAVWRCGITLANRSEFARTIPLSVHPAFGRGVSLTIGWAPFLLAWALALGFLFLAVLAILIGVFRRRWLGLVATGLIVAMVLDHSLDPLSFLMRALAGIVFLTVLTRAGLVAAVSMLLVRWILLLSPPLDPSRWYAGRAMLVLLIPLALILYGFYTSIGGQSAFGNALKEE